MLSENASRFNKRISSEEEYICVWVCIWSHGLISHVHQVFIGYLEAQLGFTLISNNSWISRHYDRFYYWILYRNRRGRFLFKMKLRHIRNGARNEWLLSYPVDLIYTERKSEWERASYSWCYRIINVTPLTSTGYLALLYFNFIIWLNQKLVSNWQ